LAASREAAFRRAASHLLGASPLPSGSAARTARWHVAASPAQIDASGVGAHRLGLSYAGANAPWSFVSHAGAMPSLIASLAEQATRPPSTLAIAFSFVPMHLSA